MPEFCCACGSAPGRPGLIPALCDACFALPQECQICAETTHLSRCFPCGHLVCAACLQRSSLARTCFFCRKPVLQARDAKGQRTLRYRRDAAQLGQAASAALGYEQSLLRTLELLSDEEESSDSSLSQDLQEHLTVWLRGELTQQSVEVEAQEIVRAAAMASSMAQAQRELDALTECLRAVKPEGNAPARKLGRITRRYGSVTTDLRRATEVFLRRWCRFHSTCWTPFEALMSAWIDPATSGAVGRMAIREGRADVIPPLLTEVLERTMAQAKEDAAQLLRVLTRLCRTTHAILAVARALLLLNRDSQTNRLDHFGCVEHFYRSFTNACSPFFDASGHDFTRVVTMLSAGEPALRTMWDEFREQRAFARELLNMSRQVERRNLHHARLRRRSPSPHGGELPRKRQRMPSSSSSSSYSAYHRTE